MTLYLTESNEQIKLEKKTSLLLATWNSLTKRAGSVSGSVIERTDPRIRTRTVPKMSQIRNTAYYLDFSTYFIFTTQHGKRRQIRFYTFWVNFFYVWRKADHKVLRNKKFPLINGNISNLGQKWGSCSSYMSTHNRLSMSRISSIA